ncbi:MAG: DNA-directed RNA polymerase subunit alpha C-terminal domain-containing protein, partial [Chloroflexota bacterium]
DEIRKQRMIARKHVPKAAWDLSIDKLHLPTRVFNVLVDNEINSIGDLMVRLEMGDDHLLGLDGFGDKALAEVKEAIHKFRFVDETGAEVGLVVEIEAAPAVAPAEAIAVAAEPAPAESVAEPPAAVEPVVEVVAAPAEAEEGAKPPVEDLSKPLVVVPTVEPPKPSKPKPVVVVARPAPSVDEEAKAKAEKDKKQKGKQLVYDESKERVVVKRARKGSRRRPDWEESGEADDFWPDNL